MYLYRFIYNIYLYIYVNSGNSGIGSPISFDLKTLMIVSRGKEDASKPQHGMAKKLPKLLSLGNYNQVSLNRGQDLGDQLVATL